MCFTIVSFLVFLMCPVAPYCWFVRVIFSSFWVFSVFAVLCVVVVSVWDWRTAYGSPMDESSVAFGSLLFTSVCVQKAAIRMEKSVNTHNRLRYFLRNKTFLLQVTYRYVRMIFIVKCVTVTLFYCFCSALMERHDFYCSVIPWNCTWYCTVQLLYFFIAQLSLDD